MDATVGGAMPQEFAQQRRVVISLIERTPLEGTTPPQAQSLIQSAEPTESAPYSTTTSEQQQPVEP
jgi:hypothetical protein